MKQKISSRMPENTDELKKELLTKLLPFNLDKEYIEQSSVFNKRSTIKLDMICILFTDIVNYTELAKKYDDKVIFQLLNNIYNNFDNIRKKYSKLQKIETIGDAYMVVGDIYRSANNHKVVIKEIILLAFELVNSIKTMNTPDDIQLSIRIGITMGNVSIGILGNEIPRLCVVGNAVNVASRLQSTADIDSIQISRHIYEKIGELDFNFVFDCILKENVFLKNLGTINTYNIYPLQNEGELLNET
jgi:class 3 adenylate cyclase